MKKCIKIIEKSNKAVTSDWKRILCSLRVDTQRMYVHTSTQQKNQKRREQREKQRM